MPEIEDDLIDVYELDFKTHSVDANPHMPQESGDLDHWLCNFANDDISFDFYISLGADYNKQPPSAQQSLDLIRADLAFFKSCPGFADFAAKLGLTEDDASAVLAFNEIGRYDEFATALLASDPKATAKSGFGG
jgi:hypothetical protein